MKWSFSADKCFRRCQRQYFFRDIAAWHNANDPLRREAFLRRQLKTLELWRGLLVHQGIEYYVVPCLASGRAIDWEFVIRQTLDLAERQLQFSRERRYREEGMTKSAHEREYLALIVHEEGKQIAAGDLEKVFADVSLALQNLSRMSDFLEKISGRRKYLAEIPILVKYCGANIEVRPDLLYFRSFGQPTIIEWKAYDDTGDSDAHLQTALYAWAICRQEQWQVSRPEEVELLEVQLLKNRVILHPCTQELFDELEDRIYRSIQDMQALCGDHKFGSQEIADFGYARNPNSCAYCSFRSLCLEN